VRRRRFCRARRCAEAVGSQSAVLAGTTTSTAWPQAGNDTGSGQYRQRRYGRSRSKYPATTLQPVTIVADRKPPVSVSSDSAAARAPQTAAPHGVAAKRAYRCCAGNSRHRRGNQNFPGPLRRRGCGARAAQAVLRSTCRKRSRRAPCGREIRQKRVSKTPVPVGDYAATVPKHARDRPLQNSHAPTCRPADQWRFARSPNRGARKMAYGRCRWRRRCNICSPTPRRDRAADVLQVASQPGVQTDTSAGKVEPVGPRGISNARSSRRAARDGRNSRL